MSKEKRRVTVELYMHEKLITAKDTNQQGIMESAYEGRLLGLIDNKQFSSLCESSVKLSSSK